MAQSSGAVAGSVITTKGDLIVGLGGGAETRLPVGSDGQMLTADSGDGLGIRWVTPADRDVRRNYGAIGDTASHTIDDTYGSLPLALVRWPSWAEVDGLAGTDEVDYAAIQAALNDYAAWATLTMGLGRFLINKTISEPAGSADGWVGRVVSGAGRDTSFIEQTGDNLPVVQTAGTFTHSIVWCNLHLTYTTQQLNDTEPQSACFLIRSTESGDNSQYWRRWSNVRLSRGTYGVRTASSAGTAPSWGCVFDDVLIGEISHSAIYIDQSVGVPSVYGRNVQIHNTNTGITPTHPAVVLVGVEADMELDIEGWHNTAIWSLGGSTLILRNPHIENHEMTAAAAQCILLQNRGSTTVLGGSISFITVNVASTAAFFHVTDTHAVQVFGLQRHVGTLSAGTVTYLTGDGSGSFAEWFGALISGSAAISYPAIASDTTALATLKGYNGSFVRALATKTTAYTATITDSVILGNAAGGAFTVTLLPAAACTGKELTIKRTSASNNVTVDGNGAETIDGATTKVLGSQHAAITIVSDGANWRIQSQMGTVT